MKPVHTSQCLAVLWRSSFLLLAGFASFAHGAESPWTAIERMPLFYGLNMDMGILVAENAYAVNGYAVENFGKRWNEAVSAHTICLSCAGQTLVAVRRQIQSLVIVRMDTGEEVWRYSNRAAGAPDYERFIGDTDWLELGYHTEYGEGGLRHPHTCLLYAPDGSTYCRLPEKHQAAAITSDEKTVFLRFDEKQGEASGLTRISALDLASSAITPGFTVNSKDFLGIVGILDSGESLVTGHRRKGEECVYSLVNAETGALIRPVTLEQRKLGGLRFFAGDKRWLFLNDTKDTLWVQDSTTGEILHTRHRAGHVFSFPNNGLDAEGRIWALSRDLNYGLWLWRADADAEPRLLLDAAKYLSYAGFCYGDFLYYGHTFEFSRAVDSSLLTAKRLEDLTTTNQWVIPGTPEQFRHIPSADLHRVLMGTWSAGDSLDSMHNAVFESGQAAPRFESEGSPLAFSPDGLYAVVNQNGKVRVFHVDSGNVVADFPLERWDHWGDSVAFSRDSRRLALCSRGQFLATVRLEEEYPVKELHLPAKKRLYTVSRWNALCFSPDGNALLVSGCGTAWLFDANTGALLKTLVEHARFISPSPQPTYVLGMEVPWLTPVKEFAGGFTDTFKNPPELTSSFILDGGTLATSADGHLLRVWDAKTGASLRTIKTGMPESRDEQGRAYNRVAFSANGVYAFAYSQGQGDASLLETTTGRPIRQYKDDRTKNIYQAYVADDGEVYLLNSIGLCRLSLKR